MGANSALTSLLVLTVITVTKSQTQYFDILQGLQQLFQPYPNNNFNIQQYNGANRAPTHKQTNRHENKKKITDQNSQTEERPTKKPTANNQQDYVFATTEKSSRKTTKSNSSQNNSRSLNSKNEYSNILFGEYYNPYEITTKAHRNKPKTTTTTEANYFNYQNRGTTQNVFGNNFNAARPVTDNVFQNVNNRETFTVNNQPKPANFIYNGGSIDFNNDFSGNANKKPQNDRNWGTSNGNNNRGTLNTDYNTNYPIIQGNDRNTNVFLNTDNVPGFNFDGNSGNNGFNQPNNAEIVFNNRGTSNFNSNDRFNTNNNRGNANLNSNDRLNTNNNRDRPNFNSNEGLNTNNNRGNPNFNSNDGLNTNNNRDRPTFNSNDGFNTNNNRDRPTFNSNDGFNTNANSSNFNTNTNRPANNWNANGFFYPSDSPVNYRPAVVTAPVYENRPPITNRPVTSNNNFGSFNRPLDTSVFTDPEPEILIGPDEDDMSEWQKRQYEDKAERMCDYYRSLTVRKVAALPLLPNPDAREFNVSDCTPINVPLIIGGTIADIRDYPHMAIVGWMKVQEAGYSWKCGGSLISDRYVLTAGHCTYQDKDANVVSGPPQAVQLGSSFLDDPGALVVKISAVIRHPKYKMRRSYHDVALIKMVSRVKFSEVIRPACLGAPPPVGRSVIATGWGRTEYGGDHSLQLRSVSLSVWNMQECQDIWGTSLKLPNGVTADSHMCAGIRSGGKDTCQGDSGGPAQLQDGCLWRVVAVTSYGRSCGAPDTPALYAVIPHAFVAAQVFEDSS